MDSLSFGQGPRMKQRLILSMVVKSKILLNEIPKGV